MKTNNQTVKDATDPRALALKEIERIENLPNRADRWRAIRQFYFALHPEVIPTEVRFVEACREMREADNENLTAASKSGSMRNTMKIPQYIYDALISFDPELLLEISGKNAAGGGQDHIQKQLYDVFPMYRIARKW